MDSEKYIIEQLLDHDDSTYYEQQQERKQAMQEAARIAALENSHLSLSGSKTQSNTSITDYSTFQQMKTTYPVQSQNQQSIIGDHLQNNPFQNFAGFGNYGQMTQSMRPPQIIFCCACKQQILHEGTYTRLLNSYTNEEVNIHFQCYEQVNLKGQAGIQNLLQSMIPKFSISFATPNHQTKQPIVGQDICVEIRFINPNTMNIINSFMNIIIPPLYDGANGAWFCQQSLYSQFSISTSLILIDFTLAIPGLHGKKARGMLNLFDILSLQSTPIVCLQIPISSRNPMYTQSNITDLFFLSFNVQLQKDEYLLSNIQFQVEFKDSGLFQFQQPPMMMQNPQSHMQMQYPMQMGMQGGDPRITISPPNQQMYQQMMQPGIHHGHSHSFSHMQVQNQTINNQSPIQQVYMQSQPQIQQLQQQPQAFTLDINSLDISLQHLSLDPYALNQANRVSSKKKKQALLGSGKFKSQNIDRNNNNGQQSAQLGSSTFKTNSSPFYPNAGQQIPDNVSAYSDSSSTMSSSQNAQDRTASYQQNLAYQRPLQFNSQEYSSSGLEGNKPNQNGKNRMYRGEIGLSPNPVMTPIDSQSEKTLSSNGKSGTSKKKKGLDKMMMFQGKSGKGSMAQDLSHIGSYVSSQTDKSSKSKIESMSQQDSDIPHFADMFEYLISQKGSRNMQDFIKKEASQEQINRIIERIRNDFGKLMIDKYGNYFCQNLLRTVSSENRLKIITFLSPEFVAVSCHDVGTHSMQRLLEIITLPEEKEVIFNAIKPEIETMALHIKGNYVLAVAFQVLDQPQIEVIVERLIPHFYELTLDKQGICIANKMIIQTQNPKFIQDIIQVLCDKLVQIIQDPFGNYAITQALQTWDNETICGEILKKFKENFVQLAIQNFSQQVLEKCVERANQSLIKDFFDILQRENVMKSMIKNQHSIFIVQKIYIRLQSPEDQEVMRSLIEKNLCYVSDKMIKTRCLSILQDPQAKLQNSRDTSSPVSYNAENRSVGGNSGPGSPMITLPK